MKIRFCIYCSIIFLVLISILTFTEITARSKKKKKSKAQTEQSIYTKMSRTETIKAMEDNCFSCHIPNANANTRVAPIWKEIKNAYKTTAQTDERANSKTKKELDIKTKQNFVESFVKFTLQPNEDNSKMPGSIKKYGIMPKFNYDKNVVFNIANFIYENDLNNDKWYLLSKKESEELTNQLANKQETNLEKSIRLATATKQVLGKNLLNAINTKGTEHAVDFCNIKALPLTDSMSKELSIANNFNAKIKRVSDKPRNPINKANKDELKYIESLKKLLVQKQEIKPQIRESKNKSIAYIPIETNKMCLQCHGNPQSDIKIETLNNIIKKYPNDKATGYGENEIRGIFVVEIENKTKKQSKKR